MSGIVVALIAYVLLQFAIGVYLSRRIASDSDYILAGRSLGPLLVTASVFATFFGAEAIVATSGAVYEKGWSGATVDPFGYALALLIVGLVFAAPLWRSGLVTFADLFRKRYSPGVEKLVVFVLLPGSLFWGAAQIRAFGQILSANSTMSLSTAIILATALVAVYSVIGGLLADSVTDLIQGSVVILGLILLVAVLSTATPEPVAAKAAASTAAAAADGEKTGLLAFLETLLVPICGTIVSVELISRFLGARSGNVAATGTSAGAVLYLVVGLMPIAIGLMGTRLLPGLEESEQIVPRLAEKYLPGVLGIILSGALVSAILSTVHSVLHGAAAQVAHNVVQGYVPDQSPAAKLWTVRLTVMALSVASFLLAITSDKLKDLVETASAFGSAGVFVIIAFGLFSRFGGVASAYGAVITGTLVWAVARYGLKLDAPYVLALVSALAAYVALAYAMPDRVEAGDARSA